MRKWNVPRIALVLAACLIFAMEARAAGNKLDYLKVVKAYADTLIEHGRDT